MIKKALVILSAVLVLASCSKEKQYDVYLFIGQSNMAGRGELLPEDTTVIPHAFILDGND